MKTFLNCEQVFEILTRGPFPSGERTDDAVERHLVACHECRELAEALRPAVALFHESIPSHELDDLPGYHGKLCETFSDAGIVTAVTLARPEQGLTKSDIWPRLGDLAMSRFAAGIVLSAALVALVWSLFGPEPVPRTGSRLANVAAELPPLPLGQQIASALGKEFSMSDACFAGSQRIEGPGWQSLNPKQCCTRCHVSSRTETTAASVSLVRAAKLSAAVTTAITQSCLVCHSTTNPPAPGL